MAQRSDVGFFSDKPNIRRQQMMAQRLMEQGRQPEGTEIIGGYAVPQSPLAGFARALTQGVGGYMEGQATKAEEDRQRAKRETMAQAIDAYSRSQAGGQTQLADGDTINWNVAPPDRAGQMYANILMGNEDTADMGMQSVLNQMQAKQNMANELDMYRQKFPMELELARQKAQIAADYRQPAELPADVQSFQYLQSLPAEQQQAFLEMKGKGAGLKPTEMKEIFEQEDVVNAASDSLSILGQMENLNSMPTYEGPMAAQRAGIGKLGGSAEALNTLEIENLGKNLAASMLKTTFTGAISNAEREFLQQLQASANKTAAERARIINNGKALIMARAQRAQEKQARIQSGGYKEAPVQLSPVNIGNPAINTPVDQIQPAIGASQMQGQDMGMTFSTPEEAEAANLPVGTIVIINGRRAVIE